MKIMPVAFIDLDGTVRQSKSGREFIAGTDDIEIIPGSDEGLRLFRQAGFYIVGVTNQGGVAYGVKSWARVSDENTKTNDLLNEVFDFIVACPFHEGGHNEYAKTTLLRKPATGMLAVAEWVALIEGTVLDLSRAIMIGDREEDMLCAAAANITYLPANIFQNQKELECQIQVILSRGS